jgi:deoxyribodipyrimidine photo-lyase
MTFKKFICPTTRDKVIAQLSSFNKNISLYARDRNYVKNYHTSVSQLSPAISHRLILEDEVSISILNSNKLSRVEKFIQEVYWRRYWKSWLSLRPEVWSDYLNSLTTIKDKSIIERCFQVKLGNSGNQLIDHFTLELINTGYLHNHARMWYAAWWIHQAKLPWEIGADFFFQNLLDACPASNTLSWKWVAGLQTVGKTYLARRSNIEKYLAADLLAKYSESLDDFENPSPYLPSTISQYTITKPQIFSDKIDTNITTGIWIHEDDLSPETSPLLEIVPKAIVVAGDQSSWSNFSEIKRQWMNQALEDTLTRANHFWNKPIQLIPTDNLCKTLLHWAKTNQLKQVITIRPDVGSLNDKFTSIKEILANENILLCRIDRPRDLRLRPLATSGFFKFWENMQKHNLVATPHQEQGELF